MDEVKMLRFRAQECTKTAQAYAGLLQEYIGLVQKYVDKAARLNKKANERESSLCTCEKDSSVTCIAHPHRSGSNDDK